MGKACGYERDARTNIRIGNVAAPNARKAYGYERDARTNERLKCSSVRCSRCWRERPARAHRDARTSVRVVSVD
jgi:hypothetical protein